MRFNTGFVQIGIGIGLWLGTLGSAIAPVPTLADEPATTVEPAVDGSTDPATAPSATEFETFTLEDVFAIDVPQGWQVEGLAPERSAVITNYSGDRPADTASDLTDIKTEVTLVPESPGTFVDRELDALIQSGYIIDQFGMTTVKGNTAFRVWLIDLPQDYTHQIITFVGYDQDRTAKIVSSYNDPSPTNVDLILEIHRSFELL
jgi:hypothetical protein